MATKDYTASAATALRLLTKFGGTAYFVTTEVTGGDGTPFNPGTETEAEHAVTAAIIDYSKRERDSAPSIQIGDRRALVTPMSGFEPAIATLLRFKPTGGNQDFQIVDIDAIQPAGPGGTVIVYDLQVRQ